MDVRLNDKKGEKCQHCGKRYLISYDVSNKLWERVTGIKDGSGIFCPKCFDAMALEFGITLRWEAKIVLRYEQDMLIAI